MTTSGQRSAAPGAAPAATETVDLDAVVAAVAAGDRAAFAHLYDALSPVVHGVAWRVLRRADLAADVTHEVMLEVWRDSPRYVRERGSVRAWVATTAHRRAVDRVRGLEAQRDRDATASHPGRDTVLEEVEHRADRTHVHDCLETLTDVQRAAVLLAYFGGRTYREVADELGTALPAARSRIRDGLDRLHTCLGVE